MSKYTGWLAGAAIFLTGAVVGALLVQVLHFPPMFFLPPPQHRPMHQMVLERLERELSLSKDQVRELTPMVEEMVGKLHEARRPFMQAEEEILQVYTAKMNALLTAEQRKKHEEIITRMKRQRDQAVPPGGPGGPGFGPPSPSLLGPPGPPPGAPPGPHGPPMFGPPAGPPPNPGS